MPPVKKNTKNSTTDENKPKLAKETKIQVEDVKVQVSENKETPTKKTYKPKSKIIDDVEDDEGEDDDDFQGKKKSVRKAGCTLLVSPNEGSGINESTFKDMPGRTSTFKTSKNAYFVEFGTIQESLDIYRKIRKDYPETKIKFCSYKLYLRITGLTDQTDYQEGKQAISSQVEKATGGNVLYFKFYRKDNHFIGCADLTVDTKGAMDKLLDRDGDLNKMTVGDFNITFYPFKADKNSNHTDGDKVMSA
jgi:hypothetical protein